MKTAKIITAILVFLSVSVAERTEAQSIELMGGNVVNGAMTGTVLGVAVMGLQDSSDFTPLRIGLGSGILFGAGVAIYDLSTLPQGQTFYISGLFNDGTNSSVLILLDTLYGAAGGAMIGSAVMLISNNSILDGLQYGSSAGAWLGFGVGLIDSFVLADRNRDFTASAILNRNALFEINSNDLKIDILRPELAIHKYAMQNQLTMDFEPVLKLFSVNKTF